MSDKRELVIAGDKIGKASEWKTTTGVAVVGDDVVALQSGLLAKYQDRISVIPLNGTYDPRPGDQVVGIVHEANPGNWIIDIRGSTHAPMHVSEAPWRVDFGETTAYLKPGDAILCKILFVDDQKKVQCTLKDRNLAKLEGGELMEVAPVKVARIIGKNGSMLNLLKEYVECWMFVGQNGRIWLNGTPQDVLIAKQAINIIANEAHLPGLTDRVRAFLEEKKPGGVDADLELEEE